MLSYKEKQRILNIAMFCMFSDFKLSQASRPPTVFPPRESPQDKVSIFGFMCNNSMHKLFLLLLLICDITEAERLFKTAISQVIT